MSRLPPELWIQILSYLHRDDIWLSCRLVSKQIRDCAETAFRDKHIPQTDILFYIFRRQIRTRSISSLLVEFARFSKNRERIYFNQKESAPEQQKEAHFWRYLKLVLQDHEDERVDNARVHPYKIAVTPEFKHPYRESPTVEIDLERREICLSLWAVYLLGHQASNHNTKDASKADRKKGVIIELSTEGLTYFLHNGDKLRIERRGEESVLKSLRWG